MKKVKLLIVILIGAGFIVTANAQDDYEDELSRTFDSKDVVRLNTLSADCVVKKGSSDEITIDIDNNYYPRKPARLKISERDRILKLTEKIYGDVSGSATWTLTVPENTDIDFNSTSGNLYIADLESEISGNTASGDYQIKKCNGQYDLNTASGDYDIIMSTGIFEVNTASGDYFIEDCEGEFDINTASGDIEAEDITLADRSKFNSASGDVEVALAKSAEYDLSVNSATGDAILDYDGNPVKGYFEFTAKYRRGRIIAPHDFEEAEKFRKNGQLYVRKWFTKGKDDPSIIISTATGKAVLKE